MTDQDITSVVLVSGDHRTEADGAKLKEARQSITDRTIGNLTAGGGICLVCDEKEKTRERDFLCVPVSNRYSGRGVLAEIEAALQVCRTKWLFVVRWDMPFMDVGFSRYLSDRAERIRPDGADAIVPTDPCGGRHLFGAICRRDILPAVRSALDAGCSTVQELLSYVTVLPVPVTDWRELKKLRHVNSPEEYDGIQRRAAPVLSVVGFSNSGKTTLVRALTERLTAAGVQVAYVKHTHHPVAMPPEEKDSQILLRAGSRRSIVFSEDTLIMTEREPENFRRALALAADADLIFLEGGKTEPFPKILVLSDPGERAGYAVAPAECAAVVSTAGEKIPGAEIPVFRREDTEKVADWILRWLWKNLQCD